MKARCRSRAGGIRWPVEARRKGKGTEQKQGKTVRFREEEQPEETRARSMDEQDETSGLEEVNTGRGSGGLGRGGDERCRTDETSGQGKGKGDGGVRSALPGCGADQTSPPRTFFHGLTAHNQEH